MAQVTTAMWPEQEPNDPSYLSLEMMLRHVIQPENMTQEQCEAVPVVSLLESLCTGQVYLPAIVFMTRAPGMQTAAIGYMLLLAILAMAYFGVRSEALGDMLRKRLALAKFGMVGLFAGLGLLVILTV